jgi:hypothetical protein
MEPIKPGQVAANLLAPQQPGSHQELERSDRQRPSSELKELAELMEQMTGRYPHQDMEAAAANYLFDYSRLTEKHGLQAVKTALLNLRIKPGQKFFPTPDEAAQELEAMKEPVVRFQADPQCECRKLQKGWTWTIDKDGDRVVTRCPCYRRHAGLPELVADRKTVAAGA